MSNKKIYDMISETRTSDILNCKQSTEQFLNKINIYQLTENQATQQNYKT